MIEFISPNVKYIVPINKVETPQRNRTTLHENGIIQIDTGVDLIKMNEVNSLFNEYEMVGHTYPVGTNGISSSHGAGSSRFCNWSQNLADVVNNVIHKTGVLELVEYETEKLIIPAYFIECSKYWRFMKYHQGGEHYPHYDSDFAVKGNLGHYTMYSVIIYFTDCQTGELAFMNDSRGNDTTDWDEQATADEIYLKIKPKRGRIVLFPHNLCHSVLPFSDGGSFERIIARGDLIFFSQHYPSNDE